MSYRTGRLSNGDGDGNQNVVSNITSPFFDSVVIIPICLARKMFANYPGLNYFERRLGEEKETEICHEKLKLKIW